MHYPTDRIAHTVAFCYTSRGALVGPFKKMSGQNVLARKVISQNVLGQNICGQNRDVGSEM